MYLMPFRRGRDFGRQVAVHFSSDRCVRSWDKKGVPFCSYLYVPETRPILGTEFHQREDEGHVFKVIIAVILQQCVMSTVLCL